MGLGVISERRVGVQCLHFVCLRLQIAMQFTKDSQAVRSPLLLAAAAGDCEKITELLKMGLDPGVIDDDKNTILHRAAMEDRYQVIKSFHDKVR